MKLSQKRLLDEVYHRLYKKFGPQFWWPGETQFEIIVGAILTQNTNWANVEKALKNLKKNKVLSPQAIHHSSFSKLAALIRPSGFFHIKAKRLKFFVRFLYDDYEGSLKEMQKESLPTLRKKLLDIHGIGPETADSILLYAFRKPTFVVDAYTKRIFYRHNIISKRDNYDTVQKMFMDHLSDDGKIFNEFHALIVRVGKEYCKVSPNCECCVLNNVNYSLKHKCMRCHRVIVKTEDRISVFGDKYQCRDCS